MANNLQKEEIEKKNLTERCLKKCETALIEITRMNLVSYLESIPIFFEKEKTSRYLHSNEPNVVFACLHKLWHILKFFVVHTLDISLQIKSCNTVRKQSKSLKIEMDLIILSSMINHCISTENDFKQNRTYLLSALSGQFLILIAATASSSAVVLTPCEIIKLVTGQFKSIKNNSNIHSRNHVPISEYYGSSIAFESTARKIKSVLYRRFRTTRDRITITEK
ncbi:hypothetical protein AGLY_006790 [Aphis glycines]|uniref:Uncharacterized protein n=1 Tax=Aphis glycines TaxID=307491 RepID=A0A6G0TQA1_APHGL|nr:hypothetical protein AGLY_006790 [Aphis glycines]